MSPAHPDRVRRNYDDQGRRYARLPQKGPYRATQTLGQEDWAKVVGAVVGMFENGDYYVCLQGEVEQPVTLLVRQEPETGAWVWGEQGPTSVEDADSEEFWQDECWEERESE